MLPVSPLPNFSRSFAIRLVVYRMYGLFSWLDSPTATFAFTPLARATCRLHWHTVCHG